MKRQQIHFLEEIVDIARNYAHALHVCISRRLLPILIAWLDKYPQQALEVLTSADIATYVTAKTHLLNSESETKTYEEFQQDIIAKAKGVFLWAILVIEELLNGWEVSDTTAELEKRLEAMPEGLGDFFGRVLGRIARADFSETLAVLKCEIGAVRPLTLNELRCALAFGSSTSFQPIGHMSGSNHVAHSDNGLERRI